MSAHFSRKMRACSNLADVGADSEMMLNWSSIDSSVDGPLAEVCERGAEPSMEAREWEDFSLFFVLTFASRPTVEVCQEQTPPCVDHEVDSLLWWWDSRGIQHVDNTAHFCTVLLSLLSSWNVHVDYIRIVVICKELQSWKVEVVCDKFNLVVIRTWRDYIYIQKKNLHFLHIVRTGCRAHAALYPRGYKRALSRGGGGGGGRGVKLTTNFQLVAKKTCVSTSFPPYVFMT
jgi:hypothetical protein